MSWVLLAVLGGLLLLVAALSAAATVVRSVSHAWLLDWVEQRLRGTGEADVYLDRPHRLLNAAGVASSFAVVLAGMIVAVIVPAPLGVTAFALFVVAVAFLLFGQLLPSVIARYAPARPLPIVLPMLRAVEAVFAPLVAARRVREARRVRGAPPRESGREEIEELLREGELEGIGERSERVVITGVLDFGARPVLQVMRPREEIFALETSLPPLELARRVASTGYSRVPLYSGDLDQIVGMIHAFDVLKLGGQRTPDPRPVLFVALEKRCSELLFEMLRKSIHLAIVRDAHGRTAGLVTVEDLVEELVGDIHDEHDEPSPPRAA